MVKTDILIDSDAFIGLLVEADVHFQRSSVAFATFKRQSKRLATLNVVVTETIAMLSRRVSYKAACQFISFIDMGDISVIYIDGELQSETHKLFLDQKLEKTSPVDCANVVVAKKFGISAIFSFDEFYQPFGLLLKS